MGQIKQKIGNNTADFNRFEEEIAARAKKLRVQIYTDRGIRKRALLGVGRLDYAFPEELIPTELGIEVIGASSDHTIIDIQDYSGEIKAGDIVEFEIRYTALLYLTDDSNVAIEYI